MTRIILTGSPNSGKSLLFNRLTGLSQKVANFPGITVDVGTGRLQAMPDKVRLAAIVTPASSRTVSRVVRYELIIA